VCWLSIREKICVAQQVDRVDRREPSILSSFVFVR
jgi:hypothetical protein